jgi:serine/threonine protein kinase
VVGTFGFMAPEQFQGRAGPSSDVYSIAACAVALLTGLDPERLPHHGLGVDVEKALSGRASPELTAALARMLETNPDVRPGRIGPLLAPPAPAPAAVYGLTAPVRVVVPPAVRLVVVAALVLVGGFIVGLSSLNNARRRRVAVAHPVQPAPPPLHPPRPERQPLPHRPRTRDESWSPLRTARSIRRPTGWDRRFAITGAPGGLLALVEQQRTLE